MTGQTNISLPLTALRSFEALIRNGNVEAAAKELNVTSSAIMHQIRALEEHCGRKLILRDKSQVSLTGPGRRLFEVCNNSFNSLRESLFDISGPVDETLDILIMRRGNHHVVTLVLNRFARENPDIRVNVTMKSSLLDETLDSYKVVVTTDNVNSDLFRSVIFLKEKLIPVGRSDYISQLTGTDRTQPVRILAVHDKADEFEDLARCLGDIGLENLNYITFNNRRDAVKAASEGIGITLADPDFFADDFYDNALSRFEKCDLMIEKEYRIMIKRRSEAEPAMKALLALLKIHPTG